MTPVLDESLGGGGSDDLAAYGRVALHRVDVFVHSLMRAKPLAALARMTRQRGRLSDLIPLWMSITVVGVMDSPSGPEALDRIAIIQITRNLRAAFAAARMTHWKCRKPRRAAGQHSAVIS